MNTMKYNNISPVYYTIRLTYLLNSRDRGHFQHNGFFFLGARETTPEDIIRAGSREI